MNNRLSLRRAVTSIVCLAATTFAIAAEDQDKPGEKQSAVKSELKADAHPDEVKLTAEAIQRNGIIVEPAKKQPLVPTFIAPARLAFNTEGMAHVGTPVKGRATDLLVRIGDQVKNGAVLVVVASPELGQAQIDYLQKKTALEVSIPQVKIAKEAYDRAKKLMDENQGIAISEVQKREADYQTAQGNQKSAQSGVIAGENNLHLLGMEQAAIDAFLKSGEIDPKYTVRAPMAGRVIQREVTLGELVSPDKEALIVLADTSSVWVLADVPEAKLKGLARGSVARVKVPAVGDEAIEGKVSHIAPALDASTRTARVRIELPNAQGQLLPGMFAQVEMTSTQNGKGEAALAVPEDAIQTIGDGSAVFVPVPNEPNTFAKRPVTIGKPVGGMVPILSGLKEGELLVTRRSFILKADLGKSEAKE